MEFEHLLFKREAEGEDKEEKKEVNILLCKMFKIRIFFEWSPERNKVG